MEFGFIALYVAMVLVRPQEWFEPIKGWRLVDVVAIVAILVTAMSQRRGQATMQILTRTPHMRVLWGLLAAVTLSHFALFRLRTGMDAFSDFGKLAILYALVMLATSQPGRLRKMMWVLLVSAMLLCVHGLKQIRTGVGFGNILPLGHLDDGTLRIIASGIFSDPNDFAMLFNLSLPFAFTMVRTNTPILVKGMLLAFIPAFLFCLYHTQSRGGMVGLAATLLAYMWLGGKRSVPRLIIAIALVGVAWYFGPARARETVYEGSAGGRVMAWGAGIGMLKQSPLFGIGYNRWLEMETLAAHSSFVNCFAELGLFGYALWFTFIWLTIKFLSRIIRTRRQLPDDLVKLTGGVFAALIGYLASGFFLTRTYNPVLLCLLGMGTGLILSVQQTYPDLLNAGLRITKKDIYQGMIAAVLSIPGIWVVIRLYYVGGAR